MKTHDTTPVLPGWLTLPDAGDCLGVTRKRSYQMYDEGRFASAHKIGDRPLIVVSVTEVQRIKAERKAPPKAEITWGGITFARSAGIEAANWLEATRHIESGFKVAMRVRNNPLTDADYYGEADRYKVIHGQMDTKGAMMESLREAMK